MSFLKVLEFAKKLVEDNVKEGDIVVDATCGNGNDTVFLAKLVGESGKVYGFDIQSQAILNTKEKLIENNLIDRVELIQESHEHIDKWLNGSVTAAMFNLGYLPGSDKTILTKHEQTIKALESLFKLLSVGGLVILIVYTGHDEGNEGIHIEQYLNTLPQKYFSIMKYQFINQVHLPPYLIGIKKLK